MIPELVLLPRADAVLVHLLVMRHLTWAILLVIGGVPLLAQNPGGTAPPAQALINEAFGVSPPANDPNTDGTLNIVVQITANWAVGPGCSPSR